MPTYPSSQAHNYILLVPHTKFDNTMAQANLDIPRVTAAIARAQNSRNGNISDQDKQTLEAAVAEIWRCIQAQPDTYLCTSLEFRIFNYFQGRFQNNTVAEKARKRFWERHSITDGARRTWSRHNE